MSDLRFVAKPTDALAQNLPERTPHVKEHKARVIKIIPYLYILSNIPASISLIKSLVTKGIKISINATGSSFASGKLLTILKDINKETPFKGANICIELTEQEAFSINDETREYLNECKEMGLQLAIDDFSMGQTTLHYLKENLFNVIKIDGSLVKGLTNSQNCREIVSSLVELADSLSLTVVAPFLATFAPFLRIPPTVDQKPFFSSVVSSLLETLVSLAFPVISTVLDSSSKGEAKQVPQ